MDEGSGRSTFAPGVEQWKARLGLARDAVRQELVRRQLLAHLPSPLVAGDPLRVLDAGCGQGTQVVQLARAGYHVLGIDLSPELLDAARASVAQETVEVQARVQLREADLCALGDGYDNQFDATCCHGLVMYMPSLNDAVLALTRMIRPGGLLSLLTRNRAGIAMRAGMTGDWAGALAGFTAHRYANRLGISDVRADDPEDVFAALEARGLTTTAWYGVRLFTDHWGDVGPPADFDDLLAAEEQAGQRDPYRRLAALTHTIGTRGDVATRGSCSP